MNILIINELYNLGGAEVFSLYEKELLEQNNTVLYLTFDARYPNGWMGSINHYNYSDIEEKRFPKLYNVIPRRRVVNEIRCIISEFEPEVIHLNGLDKYALEIYTAVKGFKVFQTIHDHYMVCPKGICIHPDQSACNGYCFVQCIKECFLRENKGYQYRDLVKWYIKRIYRRHSVKSFVCPSEFLSQKCISQGMRVSCINNPYITSEVFEWNNKTDNEIKNYLFYGVISEHKGVFQLIDAFIPFSNGKKTKLVIAGRCIGNVEAKLRKYIQNENIEYIGELEHKEMLRYLNQVDIVVVPSVGMDNYPYVVLEAICAGCIVIASNRGGMKEIINDERMIFDVMSKDDIMQKLEFSYALSKEEIEDINTRNSNFVKSNNDPNKYLQQLLLYIEEKL